MEEKKIAIIGGGNLGASIARGLLGSGNYNSGHLTVTRRKVHLLQELSDAGVKVHSDNVRAVRESDIIILAVKPKNVDPILEEIRDELREDQILVSVVTGVTIAFLQLKAGNNIPVFRAMPNTAIAIRESMTCISTNNGENSHVEEVKRIFDELGKTVRISEDLMDASTVLAACGIAFALRFVRAASQGGIEIGFDAATAQMITSQTVKGAATLLIEGGLHPEQEIDKVTTPRGITIAGLNEMEHQGFSSSLIKGILTSFEKIS